MTPKDVTIKYVTEKFDIGAERQDKLIKHNCGSLYRHYWIPEFVVGSMQGKVVNVPQRFGEKPAIEVEDWLASIRRSVKELTDRQLSFMEKTETPVVYSVHVYSEPGYEDSDIDLNVYLVYSRKETDDEVIERLMKREKERLRREKEKQEKETATETRDRKEYERLKKKFEGK